MKLKFDELKQAIDHMEKHLGAGGVLNYKYDGHLDAVVFTYKSLLETDTEIEIYNAEKDRHPTIQERVWLKRK